VKITPEIIQHDQFHKGTWFLPVNRPVWYYFMKSRNKNIIRNRTFLKTVDEPVRELVRFLHSKGFKTTPSCAGHYHARDQYEKIFNSLKKDEKEIKNGGLKLKQVESGETFIYKENGYSLPFDKAAFIKEVRAIQRNGLIGIRFGNNRRIKRKVMQLDIEGVRIEDRDGVVCIHTSETNPRSNEWIWKKITSEIKYIFQWIEYQQPIGAARARKARE
jgi:hypothetical protein